MNLSEIVTINNVPTYHDMEPIGTGAICLNYHCERLSSPVQQTLKDLYPLDQATDYKKGNLRGAFSLLKPLNWRIGVIKQSGKQRQWIGGAIAQITLFKRGHQGANRFAQIGFFHSDDLVDGTL